MDPHARRPGRGQAGRAGPLRRFRDRPLLGQPRGEGDRMKRSLAVAVLIVCALAAGSSLPPPARAQGADRAMFGNTYDRNMVSAEKGLPADMDVKTGKNVKWWADVGSQAYAG